MQANLSFMADESDPLTTEVWRPIANYTGYEISSFGRVRSWRSTSKNGTRRKIPKVIGRESGKYNNVTLYPSVPGTGKSFRVAVIVLETFVGPRPDGMYACHVDDCKRNDCLANLRWGTAGDNKEDQYRNGIGILPRFTNSEIETIWYRLLNGETPAEIARDYNVASFRIAGIRTGYNYRRVTKHFPAMPNLAPRQGKPVRPNRTLVKSNKEIWRIIKDYPNYRVSNQGNVQSKNPKNRATLHIPGWRPLKLSTGYHGYFRCSLINSNGSKDHSVHSLVATAFLGKRPDGFVCCHSDGNKLNNHISNLRWDTPKANARDRVEHAVAKLS